VWVCGCAVVHCIAWDRSSECASSNGHNIGQRQGRVGRIGCRLDRHGTEHGNRRVAVGEGGALQFRADFFNILNHPNFGLPTESFNGTPGGTGGSTMSNANCTAPSGPSGCPIVGSLTPAGTFTAPLINPANPNSGSYGKSGTGQILYSEDDNRDIQLSLKLIF